MTIFDKKDFPLLRNNSELIYLDNAATTQRCSAAISAEMNFYLETNANIHRGLYPLSEQASDMYEQARIKVARFINAKPEEIIFTAGTTDGINQAATMLIKIWEQRSKPIQILSSQIEHHSNFLPWQRISSAQISKLMADSDFMLLPPEPDVTYDLVALSLASNVTGSLLTHTQSLRNWTRESGFILLDAAQAAGHIPIDVQALDIDFLVFSGHKMYGPTGIGVLYINKRLHHLLQPARVGGGMVVTVSNNNIEWKPAPHKFEAGTPPIAQAVGLGAAIEYIESIGWGNIQEHEQAIRNYAIEQLNQIPGLKLYHPQNQDRAIGVMSFSISGLHPHDIAQVLGDMGVAVRAGHHCTQPLHDEVLQVNASTRMSIGLYNSKSDIDHLCNALSHAIQILRK